MTVAIRRSNIGQHPGEPNLLDVLPPERYTILPNTAGCYTADDAVRTARLAREAGLSNWVKLEVIGDEKTLFPDNEALVAATRTLVPGIGRPTVPIFCASGRFTQSAAVVSVRP